MVTIWDALRLLLIVPAVLLFVALWWVLRRVPEPDASGCVLLALEEGPAGQNDVVKVIERQTNGRVRFTFKQVDSALRELESTGFVKGRERRGRDAAPRMLADVRFVVMLYELTDAGRAFLAENRKEKPRW